MNKHILLFDFDEGHDLFGKASLLGSLDSSTDDFCNSLQDLAMIPPVLPLSQCNNLVCAQGFIPWTL